ncbi:hypothetical protein BIW11_11696 [Tropilaelaps mercedesae]|uniref:Uncharacterized protein n=1 Tax=Tropilaelaps mercedesae TaxID=418985 RepID=A0A1V9X9U7_9ACAR|nr:hypothetical protein BIW11_11696 [Tropilaelaps mercedesae]
MSSYWDTSKPIWNIGVLRTMWLILSRGQLLDRPVRSHPEHGNDSDRILRTELGWDIALRLTQRAACSIILSLCQSVTPNAVMATKLRVCDVRHATPRRTEVNEKAGEMVD